MLLLVATSLLLLRNRLLGAEARYVSIAGRAGRAAMLNLRNWRWPLAIAIALYLIFSTLLPVLGLATMSFVVVLTPLVAPWKLATWSNWHQLDDWRVPPGNRQQPRDLVRRGNPRHGPRRDRRRWSRTAPVSLCGEPCRS